MTLPELVVAGFDKGKHLTLPDALVKLQEILGIYIHEYALFLLLHLYFQIISVNL